MLISSFNSILVLRLILTLIYYKKKRFLALAAFLILFIIAFLITFLIVFKSTISLYILSVLYKSLLSFLIIIIIILFKKEKKYSSFRLVFIR